MPKHLVVRTEVPFAPEGENTFGLSVTREVWQTERGEKVYWMYSLPDVVQIFGLSTDGKVIVVSEFQPGVRTDYLHLPAETIEHGETTLEAARRGLQEETGFDAGSVKLLCSILENSGRSDRRIHIVIALECKQVDNGSEEGIKTILLDPGVFWNHLMKYFATNPDCKHGGGNTLKAAALGLHELGLLRLSKTSTG